MSTGKGSSEPSMEEILASIRRIISDDSETTKMPPAAPPPPPMKNVTPTAARIDAITPPDRKSTRLNSSH